jgi:Na+-driven multidrug efflux pump
VGALTGAIGLVLAMFPDLWTRWFVADAASPVRAAANLYLHVVGGFYAPFGFGLAFFFASQGAGRLKWPLAGSLGRLAVAVAGGAIAVSLQVPAALYGVIGLSFLVYALVPGVAFRLGAWAPDHGNAARG